MTERRYPLDPLERLVRMRLLDKAVNTPGARTDRGFDDRVTLRAIAVELAEDRNSLRRARTAGLRRDAAERMAEAAGFIPYEVWPEILNEDIADTAAWDAAHRRTCAALGCDETFYLESRPNRRYCSKRCQERESTRRRRPRSRDQDLAQRRQRYRDDLEFRVEALAYQAAYRSHDVIRERKRVYRREHYRKNRARELARQAAYDARKRAERSEVA